MTITEPATLITDYLLAAFTVVLARRLFRSARSTANVGRWWWATAFLATAVAGLAGGTVHGFRRALPSAVTGALWLLTLESLVAAAFAVVRGTLSASRFSEPAKRAASWVAALVFAGYGFWLSGRPRFVFAIAAYGVALLMLVVMKAVTWQTNRGAAGWMTAGVLVSALGAVVQQSGWSLHRHFNHNDLYHVVQALGIWCLYRGAMADLDGAVSRVSV